jgi:hypothetical protein
MLMRAPGSESQGLSLKTSLFECGFGRMGQLLSRRQCETLRESYHDATLFRSRVEMSRFGFALGIIFHDAQ